VQCIERENGLKTFENQPVEQGLTVNRQAGQKTSRQANIKQARQQTGRPTKEADKPT
jgi:hypothetical protein